MYKSKLQVLVQRRGWDLPEYTTAKEGPDHMPHFTAAVKVKDQLFETPTQCKSAKEAQNTAARIAYDHFNVPPPPPRPGHRPIVIAAPLPAVFPAIQVIPAPPNLPESPHPSSLPIPPAGLLAKKNDTSREVLQLNYEDTTQASMVCRTSIGSFDESYKDALHMYKNRLQQFAQKQNLGFPVYSCEAEGPPHARRFKARVALGGKYYEASELFTTLKEAEQAAAKVACQVLSVDDTQEDGGLYKNLLQEYAQRNGLLCPSYETTSFGLSHRPLFMSIVVIGSNTFRGAEAKTKKQAEMHAAKVAYCALTGVADKLADTESSRASSINECAVSDNLIQIIQPPAVIQQPQDATSEGDSRKGSEAQTTSSADDMAMNASPPVPSHCESSADNISPVSSQVEHSEIAVAEKPVENMRSPHSKTVVFPRKSNLPIPMGASVMPYSDAQWIAYKVERHQEPAA